MAKHRLVSIIIPTFNEAAEIVQTLKPMQSLRDSGHEVIVVDGGSTDQTCEIAAPLVDCIFKGTKGRAAQMHLGASQATHGIYWFVHADTGVQSDSIAEIQAAIQSGKKWGRFDVRLNAQKPVFRVVEAMMNFRSCLTGICTGDQGIFVEREIYQQIGGMPQQALMEDIEVSKRLLRQKKRPACIHRKIVTSARRWQQKGVIRTIVLMWWLRFAYFFGVSANQINRWYR